MNIWCRLGGGITALLLNSGVAVFAQGSVSPAVSAPADIAPAAPAPVAPVAAAPAVSPAKPVPPGDAPTNLAIPAVGPDGVRHTILVDQSETLKLWDLRSAFNVAALNCNAPQFAVIARAYRAFLANHADALAAANRSVDAEFQHRYGPKFIAQREVFLTQLYNYFAHPATKARFCAEAAEMSEDSGFVTNEDLPDFSKRHLGHFMQAYEDFYRSYEKYRSDLADWNAHYGSGAPPQASTPVPPPVAPVAPVAPVLVPVAAPAPPAP